MAVLSVLLAPLGWLGFVENRTLVLLPLAAGIALAGWMIGRVMRRPSLPDPAIGAA